MWTTAAALRFLSAAQMAWAAVILLRDHRQDRSAQATVTFLACGIAHTLLPPVLARGLPTAVTDLVAVGALLLPYSFWLLAKVHFDDEFRLCSRHVALVAVFTLLGYACWRALSGRFPASLLAGVPPSVWPLLPRFLGLVLVVHALFTVYEGMRSDLVVSRLRLRYGVLWVTGTYILIELLGEALFQGTPAEAAAEMANAAATAVITFVLTAASLRVRPDFLRPPRLTAEAPVVDPRLAEQLVRLLEDEHIFRTEGLTIGTLAERLGAHEYKVRQLVNDQLGFRNFNAFLNHYRIREAQKLLADPAKRHLNVAEVAYEVGYRSLGPFNKAFKDSTAQTPTEYRAARSGG